MGSGSVSGEFLQDADRVWAALGDFAAPGNFIADLISVEMQGDARVITVPGVVLRERLVERDDARRRLVYSVVEGLPTTSHRAEINVRPAPWGAVVTWEFEVSPDEMVGPLTQVYTGALETLTTFLTES